MSRDNGIWRIRGDAARLAHEAVTRAFRAGMRAADPVGYDALLREFREKTALALPSSDRDFRPSLAKGSPRAIETAIAFLEADPWFFRSGYEKENLIRHLKRAPMRLALRERLVDVVLAAIDGRDRREFRHYCRLACGVWSGRLDEEVARRMASSDSGIRRRAVWLAEVVISSGKA